eukprot:4273549-Prymnesium_polylepis.1
MRAMCDSVVSNALSILCTEQGRCTTWIASEIWPRGINFVTQPHVLKDGSREARCALAQRLEAQIEPKEGDAHEERHHHSRLLGVSRD